MSLAEVKSSPMFADPIRELHYYPVTDWAVAMLLCERRAGRGVHGQTGLDHRFRQLRGHVFPGGQGPDLQFCAEEGRRAGIPPWPASGIPEKKSTLFELNDAAAYQLPMWAEGVGLGRTKGRAGSGSTREAWTNITSTSSGGHAERQPDHAGRAGPGHGSHPSAARGGGRATGQTASKALAHGTTGAAGQHHAVAILER